MSLRRVEIAVRVRCPDSPDDVSCITLDPATHHIHVEDESSSIANSSRRSYKEDYLFDAQVRNEDIFEELVLKKMHSTSPDHPDTLCFLAYGHTGSGKTYSIAGTDEEPGILRLCVEELLRREGVVEVAMLEVYMDSVNDLLAEGQPRQIRRRQGPQGPLIVVEGLTTCSLTAAEQWQAVSAYGMRSRRTAATERNARSSRSHAIFTLKTRSVRLCLVDLAGSERQTVFSPQLNRESISINKSLSRLSTVLEALSNQKVTEDGKRSYVNFRDTTLTVLLQRYLTGASLTTFLACVHPSADNFQETLSTLRYTQRLKRIRTRVAPALAEEWSALKPTENQALLDELMRLREQVRVKESNTKMMEAAQQQRIADLERTLAAQQQQQQQELQRNGASLSLTGAGNRARDTRRVAGWLLSRILGDLPELNVGYDDYFDSLFPPSIQVIGYVSTMAGLVPRTADAEPLAFLDVGDLAMGLSMLDAGIPPFVRLHRGGCAVPAEWESFEWEGGRGAVYVLAFFEYHRTAMTALPKGGLDGEALPCCGGFVSSSSLLPIATVLCVPAAAPRRTKEEVLQRLIDLQCEQQEAVEEQAEANARSSVEHSRTGSTASSRGSRREVPPELPAALELLDASLVQAAAAEDGDEAEADAANADGSLLAHELRRQAADTSHLVTPFKESSSAESSSSSSESDRRSPSKASAASARAATPDAAADVHRDLLPDFGPTPQHGGAAAASSGNDKDSNDEEGNVARVSGAASEAGAALAAEPTKPSPRPSALAAAPATAPPPPRPLPPPSPAPATPTSASATAPPFPKKRHSEKGGKDKTAKAHGCQGCRVI